MSLPIYLSRVKIIKNNGDPKLDYTIGLKGVATQWLMCLDNKKVFWVNAEDGVTYICDEDELENINDE